MNTEEFFNLSKEEQLEILEIHRVKKAVRSHSDYIKQQLDELNREYRENQESCPHLIPSIRHSSYEDEFGRRTIGYIEYYCSDCDKRWTVDNA